MMSGASITVPVPRLKRARPGWLAGLVLALCIVGMLATPTGGSAHREASPVAQSSGWSQLPLAARGVVSTAVASDDPRYRISPSAAGLTARNPVQGLRLRFSRAGVGVAANGNDLQLALRAVGRGAAVQRLATVAPQMTAANRTVYRRSGLSEWYANGPLGLEQGFTLQHRPAGRGALTFTVGLAGSLAARATQHGQTVSFGSLAYRGLVVTDARGRKLPAQLRLAHDRLVISVSDRAARYPVRVDPFLQTSELTASDGAANDNLGASVAISGGTIVAGTPFHPVGGNANQGAVYVFTQPAGGWSNATQTAVLTASDGASSDELGWNVAIGGATIVASAPNREVGGTEDQGAVYVYTEPGAGWTNATQTAELTASDGGAGDELGWGVAVSGDTIAAGAPFHTVGTNSNQGAVYEYTKPPAGWTNATQTAELTASDGTSGDNFGWSVTTTGDTIGVGAPQRTVGGNTDQGAAYVFTKPGAGWTNETQTAELTASDGAAFDALGWAVALSGDTLAVGAPLRTVGANDGQGAVYVYTKPGAGWTNATQTAELTASDGAAGDQLGSSVAASTSTITAGAPQRSVGGTSTQGVVYVYTKPGGGWANGTETAELTASDGATGDEFGSSVAISGSTVAVGAPLRTIGGTVGQGALYTFTSGLTIATTQQPASATVGATIADKATVSNGHNPTGTVTFQLFNNATATGSPLFTDTEPLVSGISTSAGYKTTAPGTYYWVATYNGDTNNAPLASGTAEEPVTVKAAPVLSTTQKPASAPVGSSIADQATVTGLFSPSGTVTFRLYDNATATGTPLFTDTETLSSGIATSSGYPTTATGKYYWVATYSGDASNFSATSGPADEPVTVTAAKPTISTTQQPASAVVGTPIADKATVTGGYNPSGTVTFKLYPNSGGTGSPLFTDTESLSSGSATSSTYTPTATGTVYWVATYNGDANNTAVSSPTAAEPVTVTKATPSVSTTQQPASAVIGSSIADKATVSGYNATGTVTFKLYNNATATGSPLFTDTEALSSGTATSAGYKTAAVGTDYWVATYNGDTKNTTASSGPADEPVTISLAIPTVATTQQPASAAVGSSIADKATVSGGLQPDGNGHVQSVRQPERNGHGGVHRHRASLRGRRNLCRLRHEARRNVLLGRHVQRRHEQRPGFLRQRRRAGDRDPRHADAHDEAVAVVLEGAQADQGEGDAHGRIPADRKRHVPPVHEPEGAGNAGLHEHEAARQRQRDVDRLQAEEARRVLLGRHVQRRREQRRGLIRRRDPARVRPPLGLELLRERRHGVDVHREP